MQGDALKSLRVAVNGGSIGGLCSGVALRGNGAQIDIYEWIAGPMETRGAGIVIQHELTNLLEQYGAPALPHTSCSSRQYLSPDGGDGHLQPMPQQFTSWEAIYKTLRTAFPDAHYHTGASILSFETTANGIDIELSGKARRRVDLVVCADGAQSETRRRLLPEVMPHYAGYIAWRGSLPESDVPDHLVSFFDDKFSFCDARSGGHILVYLIPGANADTTAAKRLLNWVWYVHASEAELPELLTDKDGRRHHSSLPQGGATEAAVAALRDHARCEIHPRMAELVASTPDPFIQTIVDVVVPRTVFGRACLLGDAAFVVRPHTAGATAKAASDSMFLAEALVRAQGSVPQALQAFESAQIHYGIQMHRYGVALGNRWARPASCV
jgi:2-polyprenyl-6-methoxyphenol hydroxylase-like FAD-dependent oxidoreductase